MFNWKFTPIKESTKLRIWLRRRTTEETEDVVKIPAEEYKTLIVAETGKPLTDLFPNGMCVQLNGEGEVTGVWGQLDEKNDEKN